VECLDNKVKFGHFVRDQDEDPSLIEIYEFKGENFNLVAS
jgi:hypothetical protein